jgi:hypothetical protein|tara:strand:- start:1339 stop:2079 length:741 start_codon:yes stop_codon:yes gene_type:complete
MAHNLKPKKEQLPAVINFAEDASNGLADLTAQDYAIPYLSILQKTSPQLDTHDVKAGQIWNTVTEEAVSELLVIPCAYVRNFVEWVPRDQGGGLVAVHSVNDLPENTRVDNSLQTKDGNLLIETANHYVMIVTANGGLERGLVTMTSTQLKKNRRWNSLMAGIKMKDKDGMMFTPARFSHTYKLTTLQEKNDKGSWYGWVMELVSPVADMGLYSLAKDFATSVQTGAVQAGPPVAEQSGTSDDIPF